MTRKQRRLVLIGSGLIVLAFAVGLTMTALRDSIVFFNSPTDVVEKKLPAGQRIRLGGLVQPGTVVRKDVDARGHGRTWMVTTVRLRSWSSMST